MPSFFRFSLETAEQNEPKKRFGTISLHFESICVNF